MKREFKFEVRVEESIPESLGGIGKFGVSFLLIYFSKWIVFLLLGRMALHRCWLDWVKGLVLLWSNILVGSNYVGLSLDRIFLHSFRPLLLFSHRKAIASFISFFIFMMFPLFPFCPKSHCFFSLFFFLLTSARLAQRTRLCFFFLSHTRRDQKIQERCHKSTATIRTDARETVSGRTEVKRQGSPMVMMIWGRDLSGGLSEAIEVLWPVDLASIRQGGWSYCGIMDWWLYGGRDLLGARQ